MALVLRQAAPPVAPAGDRDGLVVVERDHGVVAEHVQAFLREVRIPERGVRERADEPSA
jgi:hypothetical protein